MGTSILAEWGIDEYRLTNILSNNPSLKGMLLGYVAEDKLTERLAGDHRLVVLEKPDDHDRKNKGDRVVSYKGHRFRMESKCLQGNSIKRSAAGGSGKAQCDASDCRMVVLPDGQAVKTTCLKYDEFDILAVCLYSLTGSWDFGFILNRDLPPTGAYTEDVNRHLIKTSVSIEWPLRSPFVDDYCPLMDLLIERKERELNPQSPEGDGSLANCCDEPIVASLPCVQSSRPELLVALA